MFINALLGSHHVVKRVFGITIAGASGDRWHKSMKIQKTAFWCSAFEPVMVSHRSEPVRRDGRDDSVAVGKTRVRQREWTPETVGCHPVTDGFNREMNMMAFSQFFGCERWAKILNSGNSGSNRGFKACFLHRSVVGRTSRGGEDANAVAPSVR